MKKYLLILATFISVNYAYAQQQADEKVAQMINSGDWFALQEEYPKLKDSLQTQYLKLFAQVMIAYNFNRPEEAMVDIQEILDKHQDEIGFNNTCNLFIKLVTLNGQFGNYAKAANDLKNFIEKIKASDPSYDLTIYESLYDKYNRLSAYSAPSISRPDRDVELPITIKTLELLNSTSGISDYGVHINIPVKIHGKEYPFVFDTGAPSTFMSERFAREIGVKIIYDSINIGTVLGETSGMIGFLDSMRIGDIVFKNIMVTVARPNSLDSIIKIDGVLGVDFMRMIKESQIYIKEQKIIFPTQTTPLPSTGRNFMLSDLNTPILKASINGEANIFLFDTGDSTAELYKAHYDKNRDKIEKAIKENNLDEENVTLATSVSVNVCDTIVTLDDIKVTNKDHYLYGSMGMSLVKLFDIAIINLQDMFIQFE